MPDATFMRELNAARTEFLESQRLCAYCGARFETGNELADHFLATHRPKTPLGARPITQGMTHMSGPERDGSFDLWCDEAGKVYLHDETGQWWTIHIKGIII